jgi:selenium-binding protein 1
MHKHGVATPHTSHCSPTGEIMISTLGNPSGDALGDFLCIDSNTLEITGTWVKSEEKAKFGYDFWYQPYHDALIATEWGVPSVFKRGFSADDPESVGKTRALPSSQVWMERVDRANFRCPSVAIRTFDPSLILCSYTRLIKYHGRPAFYKYTK